jgi:hypothetical protein
MSRNRTGSEEQFLDQKDLEHVENEQVKILSNTDCSVICIR